VVLGVVSVLLAVFGLTMIYNVSAFSALADFNDKYHYVKEQSQWLAAGLMSMAFFSLYSYTNLKRLAKPLFIATLLLVFAVFIRGVGIHALGASRWIDLGFISLQPSELLKLSLILYLSSWLTSGKQIEFRKFLFILAIAIGPIILQPDLGSAIILSCIAISIYFVSGAPLWQFGTLLSLMVSAVAALAISAPYRLERVKTFLNPDLDPQGASYHLRQILIAVGTGGWFGVGLGKSRQKYAYLPEVTTDSIFAVIAEEIGFIGCTILLTILLLLVLEGIKIARNTKDEFGRLLAIGITIAIAVQMIVNLGSMVSLLPLTGVPLPFLSYGGSSLIISFSMIGILINIARKNSS
jgi:cell division protein FtsW